MKKYNSYKDSGIEWIGEIPTNWDLTKLKYIDEVIMGQSPLSDECNPEGKGLPFLQGNAEFGELNPTARLYCLNPNKIAEKDDVLFSVRAPIGAVNIATETTGIGRGLCAIRSVHSHAKFLYYYSLFVNDEINSIGTGSTFKAVSVDDIKNLIMPQIPYDIQAKIVSFLDNKITQIDRLIADKEKVVELLNEERIALINQALIKGLNANVSMKDSGIKWLGEIPQHWELKKVKHISKKIGSGVTPKGGGETYQDFGIPFLRSQNIYFDGLKLEGVAYISEEVHQSMSNSKVYSSDVLINITGGSIGRCYYVSDEFKEANVNQHVCIIRPNEKVITTYLYNMLRSAIGQIQIDYCQIGGNRESVNFEQLKNFTFPLPSINEQQKILSYINLREGSIDVLISKTQSEIDLLKEYKTALISEVVTGKVDVSDEVIAETMTLA